MANNIVALNLNGNEYAFRPLYSINGSGSLVDEQRLVLGDFHAVDKASFLVYIDIVEPDYVLPDTIIEFEIRNPEDGDLIYYVPYDGRSLQWSDLKDGQLYEFIYANESFYINGCVPKTSIKYRDNKNQLQEKSIGNGVIDLSSGVYYATTASTATRVANKLTLTDVNGVAQVYDGSSPIDLSVGVNYADRARYAGQATNAEQATYAKQAENAVNAENAAYAESATNAEHALTAGRLKEVPVSIPGQHIPGEYCHIASVSIQVGEEANYSILFTGCGYNGLPEAPWSGILYFEWRADYYGDISASAKWMCLTREDLSDKITLTVDELISQEKVIHIWFAYPVMYAAADVTLIKGFGIDFDNSISTGRVGTTIATSTFSSSSNNFKYGVWIPQGAWTGQFDLGSDEDFIFECDDTIEMGPRQNGDGVYVKLATEYKQKISSLENYILTLVAENQRQTQQINDLKSTLESIVTGKTWDSDIWSGSSGTTTGEIGGVETTPEMTTPRI